MALYVHCMQSAVVPVKSCCHIY